MGYQNNCGGVTSSHNDQLAERYLFYVHCILRPICIDCVSHLTKLKICWPPKIFKWDAKKVCKWEGYPVWAFELIPWQITVSTQFVDISKLLFDIRFVSIVRNRRALNMDTDINDLICDHAFYESLWEIVSQLTSRLTSVRNTMPSASFHRLLLKVPWGDGITLHSPGRLHSTSSNLSFPHCGNSYTESRRFFHLGTLDTNHFIIVIDLTVNSVPQLMTEMVGFHDMLGGIHYGRP